MVIGSESEAIEFKRSTAELDEGVISLTSMLNKHGEGILYFGVKNNELLNIFVKLNLIEQTGHGVPLIYNEYGKDAFYISEHTVIVTIPINKDLLESNNQSVITYNNLNKIEEKCLDLVRSDINITLVELAGELNISLSYAGKIMDILKQKGYISREGSKKTGHWVMRK